MKNECACKKQEPGEWVGEEVVSELTGIAVQTLRNWRHNGTGFPYSKIGRSVRYNMAKVRKEMEAREIKIGRVV
jgi:hypothetical protein